MSFFSLLISIWCCRSSSTAWLCRFSVFSFRYYTWPLLNSHCVCFGVAISFFLSYICAESQTFVLSVFFHSSRNRNTLTTSSPDILWQPPNVRWICGDLFVFSFAYFPPLSSRDMRKKSFLSKKARKAAAETQRWHRILDKIENVRPWYEILSARHSFFSSTKWSSESVSIIQFFPAFEFTTPPQFIP